MTPCKTDIRSEGVTMYKYLKMKFKNESDRMKEFPVRIYSSVRYPSTSMEAKLKNIFLFS